MLISLQKSTIKQIIFEITWTVLFLLWKLIILIEKVQHPNHLSTLRVTRVSYDILIGTQWLIVFEHVNLFV